MRKLRATFRFEYFQVVCVYACARARTVGIHMLIEMIKPYATRPTMHGIRLFHCGGGGECSSRLSKRSKQVRCRCYSVKGRQVRILHA